MYIHKNLAIEKIFNVRLRCMNYIEKIFKNVLSYYEEYSFKRNINQPHKVRFKAKSLGGILKVPNICTVPR